MSSTKRATEEHLPESTGIDMLDDMSALEILLGGQRRALDAVQCALPKIAVAAGAMVPRLRGGGRLVYAGAGASIRIAVQDGSELAATFGFPEDRVGYLIAGGPLAMFDTLADAEDDAEDGARQASGCTPKDVLIAIAASGATPFTVAAAKAARSQGSLVVGIANNPGSALGRAADVEIVLSSGPEVIAGSTRLGAGTAQKAALNLLSTLVFMRLGAVHDGYMVNVRAGNAKLQDRAARIVAVIADVPVEAAEVALAQTGGRVKTAILLCKGAPSVAGAEELLLACQDNLRLALERNRSQ
jgi:N-acetylmuramic acid 6-phosphate etherase